jgi:secreted trypsin-like serine protease
MYSLWFLLATLQAVTMYAVWQMSQSGSRELRGSVLFVPLNERENGLEWLPVDKTAAAYCATNFCISKLETNPCSEGSAPARVLDEFSLAEGA